jgi:glutaredoxin
MRPIKIAHWLLPLLALWPLSAARAQEASGDRQAGLESRLSAPIDFWGKGISHETPKSAAPTLLAGPTRIQVRESVWAEPIQTPDGSWMLYVPPKAVLDFLEDPSEGSAKVYLAWKREQAEKLGRAMAMLAKVKAASAPKIQGKGTDEEGPSAQGQAGPATLVYFKKPSCPYCVSQDAVLAGWLPKHPEVRLDVVLPGERPELWKEAGVPGTPTLLLRQGGGEDIHLVGLKQEADLESALRKSFATAAKEKGGSR